MMNKRMKKTVVAAMISVMALSAYAGVAHADENPDYFMEENLEEASLEDIAFEEGDDAAAPEAEDEAEETNENTEEDSADANEEAEEEAEETSKGANKDGDDSSKETALFDEGQALLEKLKNEGWTAYNNCNGVYKIENGIKREVIVSPEGYAQTSSGIAPTCKIIRTEQSVGSDNDQKEQTVTPGSTPTENPIKESPDETNPIIYIHYQWVDHSDPNISHAQISRKDKSGWMITFETSTGKILTQSRWMDCLL